MRTRQASVVASRPAHDVAESLSPQIACGATTFMHYKLIWPINRLCCARRAVFVQDFHRRDRPPRGLARVWEAAPLLIEHAARRLVAGKLQEPRLQKQEIFRNSLIMVPKDRNIMLYISPPASSWASKHPSRKFEQAESGTDDDAASLPIPQPQRRTARVGKERSSRNGAMATCA